MRFPSTRRLTAGLVLAWFFAFVATASIAPWLQAGSGELICTAAGMVSAPDDGAGTGHEPHTLKCALCLGIAAPPALPIVAMAVTHPLPHVLLPLVAAHLAGIAGAPFPARGPPTFS